jgi:hypothetical protein
LREVGGGAGLFRPVDFVAPSQPHAPLLSQPRGVIIAPYRSGS